MIQKFKNFVHLLQSLIANIQYGFPSKKLKIIGVTGTDGKTTTVSMIYHILKANDYKVAMISTLFAEYEGIRIDTGEHVTTPEPWDLPSILSKLHKMGAEYVVLESTSSGLDQNRLYGIEYIYSVITNIGYDHLDYHKTWENYANAKFKIAAKTLKTGKVFFNLDHFSADWLKSRSSKLNNVDWFSTKELSNTKSSTNGIEFEYNSINFSIPIIGEHNFQNAIGAIKLTHQILNLELISKALQSFKTPKGRMEIIQSTPFSVIIDFAHTPSSLENALMSVQKIKPNNDSRIICVFGCAGDRDRKRREMGEVSTRLADITILTLEDPRFEKVKEINNEIIQHALQNNPTIINRFENHDEFESFNFENLTATPKDLFTFDYDNMLNREDAIKFALKIARDNDIVFITGKGHEQSLAIGNPPVENPFSEHDLVNKLLNK